jgi:gliding motility-associated-like protein
MAVEAHTSATQTTREVDNEQKDNDSSGALGGSAPVEISFEAVVTDAAIYHEWQFSSDSEFNDIDLRINTLEYTRQFTEYGTMYVRFVAGDNSGQCEWISETYTVNIGESKLECPNAFSPGTSEGVNDEWKVSYKSIVTFDCHIYNRWGQEVAHLTDPSQGWDGRYKGKLVKSGVFYYVIKAQGSDGRDYKLAGDINIIHATYNNSTTSGE